MPHTLASNQCVRFMVVEDGGRKCLSNVLIIGNPKEIGVSQEGMTKNQHDLYRFENVGL